MNCRIYSIIHRTKIFTCYRIEVQELKVDANFIQLSISPSRMILYPHQFNGFPTNRSTSTNVPQYPLAALSFETANSNSLSVTNMGILDLANELLFMVGKYLLIGDLSRFRSSSWRLCLILTPHYKKLCLEDVGKLSALQWAVLRGHVELIELAISNGADIEKPLGSILDNTALRLSARPGSICRFVNQVYFDYPNYEMSLTPLLLAACSGKVAAIEALLKAGASMKCLDGIDTPAHVSAAEGDIDCMRLFIDAGFDINTRGSGGFTILHRAMSGGVKMVKYLLKHAGGESLVNSKDHFMQTPLHLVADGFLVRYNRRVKTELLLQHSANIHAMDCDGNTPAHIAAFPGDVDTMRVLIAAGIDFHARGSEGFTILHRAMHNHKGVLEYLLRQEGVREIIHLKDDKGRTALRLAKLMNQWKAVERLVELAKNRGRSLTHSQVG